MIPIPRQAGELKGKMRSGIHYLIIFIVVFGEYAVIVDGDVSEMDNVTVAVAGAATFGFLQTRPSASSHLTAEDESSEFQARNISTFVKPRRRRRIPSRIDADYELAFLTSRGTPRMISGPIYRSRIGYDDRSCFLEETSNTTLRIGIPVNTRFNQFVEVKHESETGAMGVSGFSVDVFLEAMRLIEYHLECKLVPFVVANSSGQIAGTPGSYTDLLKEVHLGHFDAVVGDTTITSDRLSLVDFTLPYTDPGVGMLARLQQKQGMWFFLKPMVAQLWILFIISCVCLAAIVWLIEHQTNEQFQGSIAKQIGTALWFAFSSLFYAQRENLQSNLSRFVVSVWLFIVFIVTSAFTARLSSLLTAQQIQSPMAMDDYMGSQRGSSIHGSIVNNINFDDNRLKHYNSPEEYHEALSKGSKNGGADAIVDEIPYLKAFLARYPSQYAITGSETITGGFGFAFRKGSALVPEFSRAITKLREEGRLKQLEEEWFTNNHQSSEGGFNIYDFRGLFVLSVITNAIFLSIFLFFFIRKKLRENYFILQVFSMRYMRRMIRYMF
nr:glutamate receptor 1.2-like [Ipomoea batatas]